MSRIAVSMALVVLCACALFRTVTASPAPGARAPIYDPNADTKKDIGAAVDRAAKDNKRVLLMIGGNWCGWCYKLHDVFEQDKEVRGVLRAEYEVVNVDDTKKDVLSAYGIRPQGYPYLAVLDTRNKLVTQEDSSQLEDGPKHDPKKVVALLQKWKAPALDAQQVLDDAFARAAKEDKRVFLHVGAPWCGWCLKLEALLDQPAVDAAIQTEFVPVKIDTQRMTDGAAVAKKYQTSGGIPWYCVLSADGKVLSTSEIRPGSNIGFPTEPGEIDHVVKMFADARKRMTDEQVAAIRNAFTTGAAAAKQSVEKARAAAKAPAS